ncbi:MAG: TetR/AcrR family transcriptional regulator [bacterium]
MKNRILETARNQFLNIGYKKVTTEEIASELGISKKTLYKYFSQKNKLLDAIVELTLIEIRSGCEKILYDEELEFSQKLAALMAFMGEKISKFLKRPFLREMQKNAPQIWTKIENFRKEMIFTNFTKLIEEGIKKGEFRADVNHHLVVLIYFNAVQNIIHPEVLAEMPFSAAEAFQEIIKTLFQGILSEDARKKLQSFQN